MGAFSPVTDVDLARARNDHAFRRRMLEENMDALLLGMKKLQGLAPAKNSGNARQLREGVELAVRLAEMIQSVGGRPPRGF